MKKKINNMTMKEITKAMEDENLTFGEMSEILKVVNMANSINQQQKEMDINYKTRCEKLENKLSEIRDLIDDILDEEDEFKCVGYEISNIKFVDNEEEE